MWCTDFNILLTDEHHTPFCGFLSITYDDATVECLQRGETLEL